MKKNDYMWVVVNRKTGKVSWTRTSKRPAVFRTRTAAVDCLRNGEACLDGFVAKYNQMNM